MDIPRGGHAFPQNDAAVNRINNEAGMSLRDYFAAHVLPVAYAESPEGDLAAIANEAYRMADCMLDERENQT